MEGRGRGPSRKGRIGLRVRIRKDMISLPLSDIGLKRWARSQSCFNMTDLKYVKRT